MATAVLNTTNLDFQSSAATVAKLTASSSEFAISGASGATCVLSGLAMPSAAHHATNKEYVDSKTGLGLDIKKSKYDYGYY